MAGVLVQVLVGALLLGLGVSVFCRVGRPRPVLCHALWLLVVVKLLVPPVFAWPWQPGGFLEQIAATFMSDEPQIAPDPPVAAVDMASVSGGFLSETAAVTPGLAESDAVPSGQSEWAPVPPNEANGLPRPLVMLAQPGEVSAAPSTVTAPVSWVDAGSWKMAGWAAVGLWLGGALVSAGLHAARIRRFRRAMRSSAPGPAWLARRVVELSEAFSVRTPEVLVADGLWSAMVWGVIRPVILVPRRALEEMEPEKWETVVAHELAHLKRRDHWTAWLVLLASCVWWWNPLLWWARRRIADYAEMACDAWVLWALPERGREYADTLVQFVQAHSATPAVVPDPMPCMSSDNARVFKRRLAAILRGPAPSRLGVIGVMCLVALAAVVLPVFSQQDAGPAPEAIEPIPPAVAAAEPVVAVQALPESAPKPPGETARPEPALPEPAPAPPDETARPEPAPPEPPQALEPTLRPQPQPPQRPDPFNIGTPSEKLKQALDAPVSLDFTDFHVSEIADFVTETYELNVVLDWRVIAPPPKPSAPAGAPGGGPPTAQPQETPPAGTPPAPMPGAFPATPGMPSGGLGPVPRKEGSPDSGSYVTDGMVYHLNLTDIPLRDALSALLRTLNLTFVTYPNLLFVTSKEMAFADSVRSRPGLPPYKEFADVLSSEMSWEFTDIHISEAIEFVSETYGLNFMVDWRAVTPPRTPAGPKTVSTGFLPRINVQSAPLGEVLDVVLRSMNLTFCTEKNYIWISSLEGGGARGGFGGAALALEPTVPPQAQQGAEQTQGGPVQAQQPGETQQAPEPPKAEPGQAQGPSEAEKVPATQALGLVLHASRVADPFNVGTVSEELKEALSSEVSLDFTDVHLTDFVDFVSNTYGVNIVIDWRVVEAPRPVPRAPGQPAPPEARGHVLAEGCVTDGVVPYMRLTEVALGEAVRVLTRGSNLTVVTYPHILFITSEERALADLSLPRPGLPPYAALGDALGEVLSAEVSLDFHDAHIAEFTQFVSETYGLNIMLDWRVIPRTGVSPASAYTPKVSPARVPRILVTAAPLGETLDVVLRSMNLTFYPKANYLWISSFEEAGGSGGFGATGVLPYWELEKISGAEGGNPVATVKIYNGQTMLHEQVRLNDTIGGVRFVGVVYGKPGGAGIEVERIDEPGNREQVPFGWQIPLLMVPETPGGVGAGVGGAIVGGQGHGFGVEGSRWWDTFESAEAGTWPSAWIADGNCEKSGSCYVDGSTFGPAHGNVLRLMGEDPAMSPIAHVETKVGPPFRISFDVLMDGADARGECVVGVRERPDWTAPGVLLFSAPIGGPARLLDRVEEEGKLLPGQATDQIHLEAGKWYRVVLDLKQDSGRDQLTVTIDDGQKVQGPVEFNADGILVKDMPYLQLEMRTGTGWFDNVTMAGAAGPAGDSRAKAEEALNVWRDRARKGEGGGTYDRRADRNIPTTKWGKFKQWTRKNFWPFCVVGVENRGWIRFAEN
ncbi:MAG TPA: M56 family metallopeptidase [Candidatus Bathyarchaeia archaeon]|nr:M56 family metallopeptidase [Candidatus Bathyarchaeia archaeon]